MLRHSAGGLVVQGTDALGERYDAVAGGLAVGWRIGGIGHLGHGAV